MNYRIVIKKRQKNNGMQTSFDKDLHQTQISINTHPLSTYLHDSMIGPWDIQEYNNTKQVKKKLDQERIKTITASQSQPKLFFDKPSTQYRPQRLIKQHTEPTNLKNSSVQEIIKKHFSIEQRRDAKTAFGTKKNYIHPPICQQRTNNNKFFLNRMLKLYNKIPILNHYNQHSSRTANLHLLKGSKRLSINLNQLTAFRDIRYACEQKWKMNFSKFRLFTSDGIELFDEDLYFLKNNVKLYASRGEDFDANIVYADYEILGELGKGGFGEVLLGKHKETQQKVAIKIVNASNRNANEIEMVFREAYLLKSLNHKNIVKFYNCLPLQNMQVIMVMEYLDGGDLRKFLNLKKSLSEQEARIYFKQICEAIQYCHNQKMIHRDLKLENIMFVDKTQQVLKIVDFGIAGVVTNNAEKLTMGTLRYMAPELFDDQLGSIEPSIDVWALGIILFALVTGCMPFDGRNQYEILTNILNINYSFENKKEVSPEFKDLISRIFVADPQQRIRLYEIISHEWFLMDDERKQYQFMTPITYVKLPPIGTENNKPSIVQRNRSHTPTKKFNRKKSFLIRNNKKY